MQEPLKSWAYFQNLLSSGKPQDEVGQARAVHSPRVVRHGLDHFTVDGDFKRRDREPGDREPPGCLLGS